MALRPIISNTFSPSHLHLASSFLPKWSFILHSPIFQQTHMVKASLALKGSLTYEIGSNLKQEQHEHIELSPHSLSHSPSEDENEDADNDDGGKLTDETLAKEIGRRRNFAIISHPDAGKTTLTEKLLLYGGAIHEAGSVKARRAARHATSDWMELEKQRGKFTKGMKVQLARTGKVVSLTRPQKLFAQDRSTMEAAFAGDVIGLNNPNVFAIGDTIYTGPHLMFPGIPSFSPELFCYVRNPYPSKYKQFQKGLTELLAEGAVQVLYSIDSGRINPILAAVGQLQFEVFQYRMCNEYGVEIQLEPLGYNIARWVKGGWSAVEKAGKLYNCATVKDRWDEPVLLFRNEWNVTQLLIEKKEIGELTPYALPLIERRKA